LAARGPARRDPAAVERPARRPELRRTAPDQAPLLRGAGGRTACVLAAARRPAGPDGLRAGAQGLRDVDGREARPRPRVHRRPLGAALPSHRRGYRLASPTPVVEGPRPAALIQGEMRSVVALRSKTCQAASCSQRCVSLVTFGAAFVCASTPGCQAWREAYAGRLAFRAARLQWPRVRDLWHRLRVRSCRSGTAGGNERHARPPWARQRGPSP